MLTADPKLGAIPVPLFILDLANNHMGSVEHGLRIVDECAKALSDLPYQIALKLQYRNLDTFIHPDYQQRLDVKYIKRFQETRLSADDYRRLKDAMVDRGFLTACTPFDEASVDLATAHEFSILKVASCSFTDWPLLERLALASAPVIASTGGARIEDIDRVVNFFGHRDRPLALMHCVAVYPTPPEHLELNQIDLFRRRYPDLSVGFSTHEPPGALEPIGLAAAKGATIFEKHVGVPTTEFVLNDYSATPQQVRPWIEAAARAWEMCGAEGQRSTGGETETVSLQSLRRGAYLREPVVEGQRIDPAQVFFAMPVQPNQLAANDFSKYLQLMARRDIAANAPILTESVDFKNNRDSVYAIASAVKDLLAKSAVAVPRRADLEISHHYGLERFHEVGLTLFTVVDREYCKKLMVLLPGQRHPEQHHKLKEETFHLLYGDLSVSLDGQRQDCRTGEVLTVERNVRHEFWSTEGAVIEEVSSTHVGSDSYYTDPAIMANGHRKTLLTYWLD